MQILGYVELTIKFTQESDAWTAVCEELGTAAFGDSLEEAKEAIHDLIALQLNTLESVRARDDFFARHGIRFHKSKAKAAKPRDVRISPGELVSIITEPVNRLAGAWLDNGLDTFCPVG